MVTEGNWPKCVTASGPTVVRGMVTVLKRNQFSGRGTYVKHAQCIRIELELRKHLQQYPIVVGWRIDVGNLPRTVRAV